MRIGIYFNGKNGGVDVVSESIYSQMQESGYTTVKITGLKQLALDILKFQKHTTYFLSVNGGIFSPFCRSIFIVHGFPRLQAYGKLRFLKTLFGHIFAIKFSNKHIYVSQLTKLIYENFLYIEKAGEVCLNTLDKQAEGLNGINKTKTIIYVGRVVKEKRVEEAIQGFINSELFGVYRFIVVGTGSDLTRLRERYSDVVDFAGWVDEQQKDQYLKKSEIFVSLQELEPMGLTFLEATTFGCKIVGSEFSGGRETVRSENYSACFPSETNSVSRAFEHAAGLKVKAELQYRTYVDFVDEVNE